MLREELGAAYVLGKLLSSVCEPGPVSMPRLHPFTPQATWPRAGDCVGDLFSTLSVIFILHISFGKGVMMPVVLFWSLSD